MARRTRRVVLGGLAALVLAGAGAVPASALASNVDGHRPRAVIRYTEYGIPHIVAADFAGLGYGYGYAAATDNICVLADGYLTVDAKRSRFLGPDAPGNAALGAASNSLNSDLYFQRLKDSGVVDRLVAQPPPTGPEPRVAQLVHGYVEGYNRYLHDTGVANISDPACRGAAWVRPITDIDVYRHVYAVTTMIGSGTVIDGIVGAQPPVVAPAPASVPAARAAQLIAAFGTVRDRQDVGSNAIAVGSAGTSGGARSVLLGNPHYPWQGLRRLWQSQLTIPGRFNVTGASLLGFPAIQVGHNADVAWSHTISTATTFGLFEVPVVPGSPTTYLVDGVPEQMTSQRVDVEVLGADGAVSTVSRTLWSTRYGPVLTAGPGVPLPWGKTAFTLRDSNATNLRALNAWVGLDSAHDTDDVLRTLSSTEGIPWANTVATDRRGTALYADVQAVPNVTNELAATCSTPMGARVFPATGVSILDGGRSACAWGTDPDAVEPGVMGPGRLPRLSRTDYVTNSNNSPWLANPQAPLTGYPTIVGDVGTPRSFRTQEGILTVQRRLAGTDGLPSTGFSRDTMRQALFSDRSRVAELAAAATATMCASFPDGKAPSATGPVDVAAACPALAGWTLGYTLDSRGSLLFERFVGRLVAVPGGPWLTPFDPNDPVNTPNTLATAKPEVQRAFGDAAAELLRAGIPLDAPLGEHQSVTRAGERIPIHGAPHALGVLDVVTPVWDPAHGNTDVSQGSSFIEVVEFGADGPPRASTLLTYSQSSDPTSGHFADQTRLFSAGTWVCDRFTEHDILTSPGLRIRVLV